ncbi:hypothetical protein NJLHNGOC_10185 [Novacetimonas cocois]|uniref:Uncharacterized protein n=1 Tax=Novacetimonas cocois TaxID=1747507 RepID=A0A365YUY0_9PROT|nr:hypothetical protein NJLHNGOC_10185 [Novacetimonas cocois]
MWPETLRPCPGVSAVMSAALFAAFTIERHENAQPRGCATSLSRQPARLRGGPHYECDPAMPQISDAGPDA